MKRIVSGLFLLLSTVFAAWAQTQSGELTGKVTNDKGESVPFANVAVKKNGILITGATTDFDGYYSIKPLDPGKYDVEVSEIGHQTSIIKEVSVGADRMTTLNVKLKAGIELETVVVTYVRPLIDPDQNSTKKTVDHTEIISMPTRSINAISSTTAGVYQEDENKGLNIKGSREEATEYYIDGIRVRGSTNLPAPSIEELTVITGGVPARYGDATGGIINITTRGPSKTFQGGLEGITSQGMDPVGYNLVNFNLTGPIYTKNKGTDSSRTMVGFFVTGEYLRQKDNNPSAIGNYRVKQDVLDDLEKYPLVPSPVSDAFTLKAETLTFDDLEKIKTKVNTLSQNVAGAGKIDFKFTDNIQFTLGGNVNYNRYHDWIQRYGLMNWKNNPLYNESTYRVYGRFTQKFRGKTSVPGEEQQKQSVIQNAYYSVQFDYTKVYNKYEDDDMKFNPFNYGHVGNFDVLTAPLYAYGTDATSNKSGWILQGYTDTLVKFTPSDFNPETANYTRHFYELAGDNTSYYRSLDLISLNGGLRNGDRPQTAHGIWNLTGRQFNGYGVSADNDQFRMFVSGAFDIVGKSTSSRNKHAFEFGFEFDQRVDRSYQVTPIGLWQNMRQLANRHILALDTENPILRIDGVEYAYNDPNAPAFGQNDTVVYNRLNDGNQSYFDKQLRIKLGLDPNGTDFINTDGLSPETFDLKMFSPDELLNQGNPFVFYYGYDPYGKKVNSRTSFNDFFTQKDENGNYTRAIGAFRPVYASAFIQDKFVFKDVLFNIGVRVDRFDANQKVLKDKYLLYDAYTVGEAKDKLNGNVPSNIGSDYIVYVDDFAKSNPTPIGYRNGDTWYNSEGAEIVDPSSIARGSSSGRITPFLINPNDNIKNETFDPNTSFKDYDPQIIVMPRVSFSFNLTDKASFFAHYDILAQRPQGRLISTPVDWYFFENNIGGVINNPNLKPEKTIDYQLGFRQALSEISAITISAFYRDLKDMVQVINVNYAYPRTYLTFGNRDFGNVKGILVDFELRKKQITDGFSLRASYTLQFADGTGSNSTSQFNLVNAGQPNLRTVAPLSYDSRHLLTLTADYSFGEGKRYSGPVTKSGKQILAKSGINIIFRSRSGEPYTKQSNATPEALTAVPTRPILAGSLNGQRLPWNFRLDMRVHKDFKLTGHGGKKAADESGEDIVKPKNKRDLYLNVYVLIQNLFNTANIISVYPYTGNPDDDGYITSPAGQLDVANRVFGDNATFANSFSDLYQAYNQNPNNFSLPRQVRIGAIFTF